jgi:hypothetical protein
VPRSLLPPLATGKSENDRKNIKCVTSHGATDVSISLLGDEQGSNVEEAKLRRRVTLDINSGSATKVKIVGPSFSSPLHLVARIEYKL